MAVLITGGAGYVGSHTCIELLEQGYELVVVDNFCNSNPEMLDRIKEITGKDFTFYAADLLDSESIEVIFQVHEIQAVIHFAGLKAVNESVNRPLHYYQNNLISSLNLLQLMEKYNVYHLVFSSSATVYGNPASYPIREDSSLSANNPYGRTKLMIEQILQDLYTSNDKWSIALLRYFNPIGAHESGKIGEDPKGIPNNLLPYIAQVAAGNLEKLTIYGEDYETPDGTGVRDYIHVMDLAKGHVRALEKILCTTGSEAYNLGTGKGYSVKEMVKTFERASGRNIPYSIKQRRPGDIAVCYADPLKTNLELNWVAERDIFEMCEDTWRWQLHLEQIKKQQKLDRMII